MARGQMVRWLAENNVTRPEDLSDFNSLGYRFSKPDSAENELVFLKE